MEMQANMHGEKALSKVVQFSEGQSDSWSSALTQIQGNEALRLPEEMLMTPTKGTLKDEQT